MRLGALASVIGFSFFSCDSLFDIGEIRLRCVEDFVRALDTEVLTHLLSP